MRSILPKIYSSNTHPICRCQRTTTRNRYWLQIRPRTWIKIMYELRTKGRSKKQTKRKEMNEQNITRILSCSEDSKSVLKPLLQTNLKMSNSHRDTFHSCFLKAVALSSAKVLWPKPLNKSTALVALKISCSTCPFCFLISLYLCSWVAFIGAN